MALPPIQTGSVPPRAPAPAGTASVREAFAAQLAALSRRSADPAPAATPAPAPAVASPAQTSSSAVSAPSVPTREEMISRPGRVLDIRV